MAIIINDNFAVNVGKPVDSKYLTGQTAWLSVSAVNANIPISYRYPGLTVNINNVEYWYKCGLGDTCLIPKQYNAILPNTIITGATNGLNVVNGIVRLGGTITGSTTLTLTGTSALIIADNRATKVGIVYAGDYSSGFTTNSLVTKGFVLSLNSISASGERITKTITQASHGFNVKDVIGFSGTAYSKAIADGMYDGEFIGIVSKCCNANIFDLTQAGYVSGLTGLIINTTYFLSDVTAGLITSVAPTTPTHISKAVMIANSTTSGWVLPYPGVTITSGSSCGILVKNVCLPSTSTYVMTSNDFFVGVSGGTTVILPTTPQCGMVVIIADISNTAASFPIAIVGSVVGCSVVSCVNTDSGSLSYIYNGTRWNVIGFAPAMA